MNHKNQSDNIILKFDLESFSKHIESLGEKSTKFDREAYTDQLKEYENRADKIHGELKKEITINRIDSLIKK